MWILSILPDIAIHIMMVVSLLGLLAGFVLGFIPFIKQYQLHIQVCGILLLGVSTYLEGGISEKNAWNLKVKELENRVAKAEAESAKANSRVVTKIVTKNQIIKDKAKTVTEYIDREVVKYDKTCTIPAELIRAHNAAATNDITLLIPTAEHNSLANPPIKLAPKK